jgi:hypothetical protein
VISTAVFLIYHIVSNPEQITKLRQELATIDDVTQHSQLQNLTHLNAVIDETLRLHPSVPSGGLRDTPPEGITVGSTYIPGNTIVLVPHYSLGRREYSIQFHRIYSNKQTRRRLLRPTAQIHTRALDHAPRTSQESLRLHSLPKR